MDDPNVLNCITRYRNAHFSDQNGYQSFNHNLMREDVILQMYEYSLIFQKSFSKVGWNNKNIPSKRVLEVGSAWGLRLNQLLGFNFAPKNLFGIDLQQEYIDQAKLLNPFINNEVMSATDIHYPDNYFDCSLACVVLQAMIDDETIEKSLSEMCRVAREFILIVDIFNSEYTATRNGSVYLKGVDIQHIKKLQAADMVEKVYLMGSFWTMNNIFWRLYRLLNRIGLTTISYAIAIRLLAKHSHKAYLIKLRKDEHIIR